MSQSCGCNKRIISSNAKKCNCNADCCNNSLFDSFNDSSVDNCCNDVCVNPSCGNPVFLTCLAPVVYDEIGINICNSFSLTNTIASTYSTAAYATAEVTSIVPQASTTSPVSYIKTRPNCCEVTLSNLSVNFAIKFYDCCKNLLGTEAITQVPYLNSTSTNPETNPPSVTLELFAPYGVSYTDTTLANASINYVTFTAGANTVSQGINVVPMAKVLSFDLNQTAPTMTVGLTLVAKVIYFVQYLIPHNGKPAISKGSISPDEASACSIFVNGSLLDRSIKPLEPFNPFDKKEPCEPVADATACIGSNTSITLNNGNTPDSNS